MASRRHPSRPVARVMRIIGTVCAIAPPLHSAHAQTDPQPPPPLVREAPFAIVDLLDLDGGFDFRLGNFGEPTRYVPIIDGVPYDPGVPVNPGWWINAETTTVPVARDIRQDARTHHYVYQGSTATVSLTDARARVDFLWHQRATFDNSLRIWTAAPQDSGKGQRDTFYYLTDQPPYGSQYDAPPWRAQFSAVKPQTGPYTLPDLDPLTVPVIDPSEASRYANEGRNFLFRPSIHGTSAGDADTPPPIGVLELDLRMQVDHHYRKIEKPVIHLDFLQAADGMAGKMGLFGQRMALETGTPFALQSTTANMRSALVSRVQEIFDEALVPVLVTDNASDASDALKVVTVRFGDAVRIPCSTLAGVMGYCDPSRPPRIWGLADGSDASGAQVDQFDQDPVQSVRVFAQLAGASGNDDVRMVAGTIAHEVAHTYGAAHLDLDPADPHHASSLMQSRGSGDADIDLDDQAFSDQPGAIPLAELPVRPQVTHNPVYHMRRWAAGEDADYLAWDGLQAGSWEQIALADMLTTGHALVNEIYLVLTLQQAVQSFYDLHIDPMLQYGDDVGLLSALAGPLGPGTHALRFQNQAALAFAIVGGDPDADFLDVGLVTDLGNPQGSFRHIAAAGDTFGGHVVRAGSDGALTVIGNFGVQVSAVPEPGAAVLFMAGIALLGLRARGSARRRPAVCDAPQGTGADRA